MIFYYIMSFLNLEELNDENKVNCKKEAFNKILELCHKKIRHLNKSGVQECLYLPPKLLFGYPLYNYNEIIQYIINSLYKNGLYVKWDNWNNQIYISWKKEHLSYDRYNKKDNDYREYFPVNIN